MKNTEYWYLILQHDIYLGYWKRPHSDLLLQSSVATIWWRICRALRPWCILFKDVNYKWIFTVLHVNILKGWWKQSHDQRLPGACSLNVDYSVISGFYGWFDMIQDCWVLRRLSWSCRHSNSSVNSNGIWLHLFKWRRSYKSTWLNHGQSFKIIIMLCSLSYYRESQFYIQIYS